MTEKLAIIKLFELPKDVLFCKKETIYETFSCALILKIKYFGQLYITDNNLCFFSTVLG